MDAVDATEHMALVLDPTGVGNGPEIVWVTAHTGSATTATIVRGREGTSGVQHASTITWVHVATASDFTTTGTTANRPSSGGLPFTHQRYFDTTLGCEMVYNGSAWLPAAMHIEAVRYGVTGSDLNCTATTYASMDAANLTTSFTKRSASTDLILRIDVSGAAWNVASPGFLTAGVRVDATDYGIATIDVGDMGANGAFGSLSGERTVSGIAAGTYTCLARWRVETVAGGAYAYLRADNASVSFSVTETAIGN